MKIYLMQHGDALSDEQDTQRPLSDKGRAQIKTSAAALVRMGLKFDAIIASSKLRSRQTADIVAEAVGYTGELTETDTVRPRRPTDGRWRVALAARSPCERRPRAGWT